MNRTIYLDHAATTPVKREVFAAMEPYLLDHFWNPSSLYKQAVKNMEAVNEARIRVAYALKCYPEEVYFTSGGTEADNWAIKGVASAYKGKGKHIITSAIEHPAVKQSCAYLRENGFSVTSLPVEKCAIPGHGLTVSALRQIPIGRPEQNLRRHKVNTMASRKTPFVPIIQITRTI